MRDLPLVLQLAGLGRTQILGLLFVVVHTVAAFLVIEVYSSTWDKMGISVEGANGKDMGAGI